jgi:Ca2+-binding EF-hand superfamily protein
MNSIFKPSGSKISIKEFRNIMSNLGEKLTEDELNELFKELKLESV